MKRSRTMEFGVGLFILVGILGLVFLGLRVSGLTFPGRRTPISWTLTFPILAD